MIDYSPEKIRTLSFRDLLEEKAVSKPELIFIHEGNESLTYGELNSCADFLACKLIAQGAKKGTHIGIYGANSINWIITFFAIQKIGAISVLINSGLAVSEVSQYCKIADITHLCYGETAQTANEDEFLASIKNKNSEIKQYISIKNSNDFKSVIIGGETFDKSLLTFRPECDDVALMIYTSGSTGKPKCALLSAYNVLTASYESMLSQHLSSEDRVCFILPLFHIFGLVAGLCSDLISDAVIYIPNGIHTETLINTIYQNQCTVFHAVPTMMLMIIANKTFTPEKLQSLRCTILSAAAATKDQIEKFHKFFPNNHFLSAYGLTEAAPVSNTLYNDTLENCIKTVGLPLPQITLEIRNLETGEKCKTGEEGEIVLHGDNIMVGYYKINAEDQSIGEDGYLHTGDIGYLREDGYLCLSGRLKDIIIRGGENIYPNEVASIVNTLPEIEDVKVVAVPSDFYGEEVCACIKLFEGKPFDEKTAKEILKTKMARFKIPSYFIIYEKFPLLANGKVDMVTLKKEAARKMKIRCIHATPLPRSL